MKIEVDNQYKQIRFFDDRFDVKIPFYALSRYLRNVEFYNQRDIKDLYFFFELESKKFYMTFGTDLKNIVTEHNFEGDINIGREVYFSAIDFFDIYECVFICGDAFFINKNEEPDTIKAALYLFDTLAMNKKKDFQRIDPITSKIESGNAERKRSDDFDNDYKITMKGE